MPLSGRQKTSHMLTRLRLEVLEVDLCDVMNVSSSTPAKLSCYHSFIIAAKTSLINHVWLIINQHKYNQITC